MVTFKTKVYKVEEEDVIGAEVTIYSEAGDKIKEIYITSAEALNELENRLTDLENRPVNQQQVTEIINNLAVNATTLEGQPASDFAASGHTHNYAPINHRSSNTNYGVGTASEHGHVKVVDNVTTSSFNSSSPVVLSAKQGYVLNNELSKKVAKTDVINNLDSELTNQPLSAKMGKLLQSNINTLKNNIKQGNHMEFMELGSPNFRNDGSYYVIRNGWCFINLYVTINGSYYSPPLNLQRVNGNLGPYTDFLEGAAQVVGINSSQYVEGHPAGRYHGTIQIVRNNENPNFPFQLKFHSQVNLFDGDLIFGTLAYPIRNYNDNLG